MISLVFSRIYFDAVHSPEGECFMRTTDHNNRALDNKNTVTESTTQVTMM